MMNSSRVGRAGRWFVLLNGFGARASGDPSSRDERSQEKGEPWVSARRRPFGPAPRAGWFLRRDARPQICAAVSPRWSRLLLLFGCLTATGGHWDVLQVWAWARMIVASAETSTWGEAVVTTLTSGEQCEVCQVVETGKKQQGTMPGWAGSFTGEPLLIFSRVGMVIGRDLCGSAMFVGEIMVPASTRAQPPVPPPRVLA